MKAVAGTAALAIQPLGSVLLVGSLVADQALKVTFNPALFEPGSTELDPAAQKYLTELAAKLRDKPKLALRVCGVAVDAERSKDEKGVYLDKPEGLLEMAQQRSQAVRQFMIAAGTGEKQLRSCRPSLDPKPEARPRVDIRL
jgi:outer membrane protein OmpA-like peptidoglycan-associated protein